ncbi:MAG: hypothetical protein GY778_17735 [bacterium]|nr:hypothetical protein [bacterium]
MGFVSGRISFRRYRVCGSHPGTVDEKVVKALRRHVFTEGKAPAADGIETGWIAPTHVMDTQLTVSKISVGRFLHLAMRLDRTAAPPAVLRSYRRMEEQAALEASGKQKIGQEDRRRAHEAADERAEKEARQGAFRRISAHPVLVDLERHQVYFASLGNTANDKLRLLFADTFGATLEPADVSDVAVRLAQDAGWTRACEDAAPCHLIDKPAPEQGGPVEFDTKHAFLGREFLTWLWYEIDQGDGMVALSADGRGARAQSAGVLIERMMQLDCDFQVTGRDVIYNDNPTGTPEARAALHTGKQPVRLGLTLAADGADYSLVFDAAKMQVSGATLPNCDEPDPSVRLEERCEHAVHLAGLLDGLLAAFLKERFGRNYSGKLARIRRWSRNGHAPAAAVEGASADAAALAVVQ